MTSAMVSTQRGASPTRSLIAPSPIDGLLVRRLAPHVDARGAFTEIFSRAWPRQIAAAQWSLVSSQPGALRGMHLHRRHDEYFLLVSGRAWVGLRDVRPGSPSEGRSCLLELRGDEPTAVSFPRGIVHGWCFGEPSLHLQATTEPYSRYACDDNLGCHWSDPALELEWPLRPTRVAPRAEAFPSLARLMQRTLELDPDFRY